MRCTETRLRKENEMRTLLAVTLMFVASVANAAPPRATGCAPSHVTPSPWVPTPRPPATVLVTPVCGGVIVRTNQNPYPVRYNYGGQVGGGYIYTPAYGSGPSFIFNPYVR